MPNRTIGQKDTDRMPDLTAVECRSNGGQTAAASQTCRIAYLPRRMLFILQAACTTGFPCQILSARRAGISASIIPYRQISYIHISINIHIVNRRTAIMHRNLKVQYRRNQAESDRHPTEAFFLSATAGSGNFRSVGIPTLCRSVPIQTCSVRRSIVILCRLLTLHPSRYRCFRSLLLLVVFSFILSGSAVFIHYFCRRPFRYFSEKNVKLSSEGADSLQEKEIFAPFEPRIKKGGKER